MSSYHVEALAQADIFTFMGSIYAEVARYDSAVAAGQVEQANQAVVRAQEIIDFAKQAKHINAAQKAEIEVFDNLFLRRVRETKKSGLDDYLLPFAVSARRRQFV